MSLLKKANKALRNENYIEAYDNYKRLALKNPLLKNIINSNLKIILLKCNDKELIEQIKNFQFNESSSKLPECTLRFENIQGNFITGWALDKKNLDRQVSLETFIDGKPYSLMETSQLRKDVQNAFGGEGYYGFKGEINKFITFSKDVLIRIEPLTHKLDKTSVEKSMKKVHFLLKGKHFDNPNEKAKNIVLNYIHNVLPTKKSSSCNVSVIILNLNGEAVLRKCIQSILKWNNNAEIIVVDHASSDNSVEMLKSFNNSRIIVIERDKNYSYSESNNLGAQKASGDVLIFLNNDIILTSDSISYMVQVIKETDFGLLGIKLWDYPSSKDFILNEKVKVNQHLGVHFDCTNRSETIEAFELRNSSFIDLEQGILETPAVTAAMMAIDKDDFFNLNGFGDAYFYGQEDVDFCLRFGQNIRKRIGVVLEHGAFHIRGLSRKTLSQDNTSYINNNRQIIQEKLGADFRKQLRTEKFLKPCFWNHKPISVAMIVSEVSFETSKADFFTAKELGDAFEEDVNCTVGYFDTSTEYDVAGYDMVVVFIDGFNPEKLKNVSPSCQIIAWARNWFDRWCEREWIEMYDIVYASSEYAREYMEKTLKREVKLLRIAASTACLHSNEKTEKYKSDYVFTGSYFNSPREITDCIEPESIPFDFKLFGYNWEEHDKFKKYTLGSVSYKDVPKVYSSTKLVIDDANIATKKWGALNCRVYDALANGTLCITNNKIGIREIFDEQFPIYSGKEVNEAITDLLKNESKRAELVDKYRKIVLEHHTYKNRKENILNDVIENVKKISIAIKIAAPDFTRAVTWGDYYFAIEMRYELEKLGYKVRIDCLKDWNTKRHLSDDINIVLRGLNDFQVRKDQVNILWVISHPDLLSEKELNKYDHIFVASKKYTEKLNLFIDNKSIDYLPQASAFDENKLNLEILSNVPEHEILFIGNSRNEYREVVKWCVEKELPLSVYGGGWDKLIPKKYIKGNFIENELIPYYYKRAKVVLNDHWDDMKKNGFISNRIYDVLAVGGTILTDYVVGMEDFEGKQLFMYHNKKSFYLNLQNILKNKKENFKISDKSNLTFKSRMIKLNNIIGARLGKKDD
jgi:GT2 family glycosyltransferase